MVTFDALAIYNRGDQDAPGGELRVFVMVM
jgi:hypothetical protein